MTAVAVLAAAFTMSSCADFLDVVPEGYPTQNGFFATDKDALDAIDAVYWGIARPTDAMWGRDLFWEQGAADDIMFTKSRDFNIETLNFNAGHGWIRDAWDNLYTYMANAQWVIQSLLQKGEGNLSAIEKRVLGEAYFMRAFYHFHVAYRHGTGDLGVPYEPWESFEGGWNNQIYKQQESVVKNYEMIISDLEKAAERLPFFETYTQADYGRTHKVAAWALMVKVYAYWAFWDATKWEQIPALVDKIESEGHRALLADCADPFKMANNYSSEYIFSVTSTGGSNPSGSEFTGICLRNKAWGYYNGWGSIKPTHDIYEEYMKNPGDKRLQLNLIGYQSEINTFTFFGHENFRYTENGGDDVLSGYSIAKYMEPYTYGTEVIDDKGVLDAGATAATNPYISTNGDYPTTDLDVSLIRHAEMVLFKAEALVMMGKSGAAAELNRLTERAGLGQLYTEGSVTMDDVMHERRCELAFEFTDRFMDLKRWSHLTNVKPENKTAYILSRRTRGNVPVDPNDPDTACEVREIWPLGDGATRTWKESCMVFPYPSQEIVKAGGAWHQPEGY